MCKLLSQQDLFHTMIRNGNYDFESFPATIAVERMEAKKAFDVALGKFCSKPMRKTEMTLRYDSGSSYDGLESFPCIEWIDDDEEDHEPPPFELRTRFHCGVTPTIQCSNKIRSMQAKRAKMNDAPYSLSEFRKDKKGLVRSRRILTALSLLLDVGDDESTKQETRNLLNKFSHSDSFASSFTGQADVNLEKVLQMSFCDGIGDTSVTMVA